MTSKHHNDQHNDYYNNNDVCHDIEISNLCENQWMENSGKTSNQIEKLLLVCCSLHEKQSYV